MAAELAEGSLLALVVVAGELLHLALAPTLIFGLGPAPALGVAGAGVSLVISNALRAATLAGSCWPAGRHHPVAAPAPPSGPVLGHPAGGRARLDQCGAHQPERAGGHGPGGLLRTYATYALAGYGLGARLEYLQILLVFGLGTALVTMVGTSVGAGRVARARRVAWTRAGLVAAVTGTIGLLAALLPGVWLGTFTAQPEVVAAGALYLRVAGPSYALFGLGLALYFASQGTGRLLWPVVAGVARLLVVAVGGIATRLGWGLPGLYSAVALGFVIFGAAQAVALSATLRAR